MKDIQTHPMYPILALAVLYTPLQSLECKYEEEVFGLPDAL